MEFTEGKRFVVSGSSAQLRHLMHYLPIRFHSQGKTVLIVDTINSLNLHHPFFNDENQKDYFENIFCVRTPWPYDLWARLTTAGKFIRNRNVGVLLITNLSKIFRDYPVDEVEPLLGNILKQLDSLTQRFGLITIIANSPHEEEPIGLAYSILSEEPNLIKMEVET